MSLPDQPGPAALPWLAIVIPFLPQVFARLLVPSGLQGLSSFAAFVLVPLSRASGSGVETAGG